MTTKAKLSLSNHCNFVLALDLMKHVKIISICKKSSIFSLSMSHFMFNIFDWFELMEVFYGVISA